MWTIIISCVIRRSQLKKLESLFSLTGICKLHSYFRCNFSVQSFTPKMFPENLLPAFSGTICLMPICYQLILTNTIIPIPAIFLTQVWIWKYQEKNLKLKMGTWYIYVLVHHIYRLLVYGGIVLVQHNLYYIRQLYGLMSNK